MIYSLIHPGSGLGNQLHRYVAGKVLAQKLGVPYSAIGRENFKGKSFMDLDFGPENDVKFHVEYPAGKIVVENKPLWEEKTNYYNPEFNFVEDETVIDGEFQSWNHWFKTGPYIINRWLKAKPPDGYHDVCIIGFRGGEFYMFPELGLPKEYFEQGMEMMRKIKPDMKFEVHTDDPVLAQKFFPNLKVIHDISLNWRSIRYAQYAIIANSSFYILPRWLRHLHDRTLMRGGISPTAVTIAPRYWARRNVKEWSRPDNYYPDFIYI